MAEIKEKSLEDYEKTIEKLKVENENLKLRIVKLEQENSSLLDKITSLEKSDTIVREKPVEIEAVTTIKVESQKDIEKPIEIFKEMKKEEEPIIVQSSFEDIKKESPIETPLREIKEIFFEQAPPELAKKPIVEGASRRECPICGNTNKMQIREIIDKTHMISDYPRMYGKKYKCGSCGREWRLSSTLE